MKLSESDSRSNGLGPTLMTDQQCRDPRVWAPGNGPGLRLKKEIDCLTQTFIPWEHPWPQILIS